MKRLFWFIWHKLFGYPCDECQGIGLVSLSPDGWTSGCGKRNGAGRIKLEEPYACHMGLTDEEIREKSEDSNE
jgi:hypothetical protein